VPKFADDAVEIPLWLAPTAHADARVFSKQIIRFDVVIFAVEQQLVLEACAELLHAVELTDQQLVLAERRVELQFSFGFDTHVHHVACESPYIPRIEVIN
jgi:hypothetical protein